MMHNEEEIGNDDLLKELYSTSDPVLVRFADRCVEITHQIRVLMDEKKLKPVDLASLLGKEQSEVSKLLSGTHNFTLKTLMHIETALNEKVVHTIVGDKLAQCADFISEKQQYIFLTVAVPTTNLPPLYFDWGLTNKGLNKNLIKIQKTSESLAEAPYEA